jgi:hypothetical protein
MTENPRHTPVTIGERMHPGETMMGCRTRHQTIPSVPNKRTVKACEALKESFNRLMLRREMLTDRHIETPPLARLDDVFMTVDSRHTTICLRKHRVEIRVQVRNEVTACNLTGRSRPEQCFHL